MVRGGKKLSFLAVLLMLGVFLLTGCGDDDGGGPTSPGPGQVPGGFALVQPGTFTMGSPSDEPGRGSNETQHQVTLTKAFYISDHEVTQAEWEYACRATSTTAFCNGAITELYCGIDANLTQVGWYCGNANDQTHDVMGKSPNAWNLYDMHGNVNEWCWDWKGSYSGPETDPTGPASGSSRVLQGGSWRYDAQYCRSGDRGDDNPSYRSSVIGLRLSRTAP